MYRRGGAGNTIAMDGVCEAEISKSRQRQILTISYIQIISEQFYAETASSNPFWIFRCYLKPNLFPFCLAIALTKATS